MIIYTLASLGIIYFMNGCQPKKDVTSASVTDGSSNLNSDGFPYADAQLGIIGIANGNTLNTESDMVVQVRVKDTPNEYFCLKFNSREELRQMKASLNNNDEKILFFRRTDVVKQCEIKLDAKFIGAGGVRGSGFIPGQMVTRGDLRRNRSILAVSDNIPLLEFNLNSTYKRRFETQLEPNNKISEDDSYVSWDNLLQ